MTLVRLRRRIRPNAPIFFAAMLLAAWVTAQLPDGPIHAPKKVQPNDAVYAPRPPTLRFSHAKHADQACTTCHAAALTSRRASESLRPAMSVCVDCHNQNDAAPDANECATCHVGYSQRSPTAVTTAEQWRAVRPAPMVPPAAQAALRFDHARHVPRLGGASSCTTCHGSSGEPRMPTMQSCNTCHDGSSAPSTCTSCHPTGDDGKLRGRRQNVDVEPLRPDNHGAAFTKRHGSVARSGMQECMSCHVEQDCASCHNAQLAQPFTVHPPNFVTIHAVDARTNSGDCVECHTVQTFCTSCHVRADVVTREPHAPPALRQYHPPGWLEASAANNHGVMARRDITECASCHSEQDCITCHAGVNPHPPEFSMTCRRLLTANAASCMKCHDDLAGLRALCP